MQRPTNNNRQMFESSLELKCLFFFGVALLVVITVSFWMYWSVTEALIMTQNETMARSLAKEHLVFEHVREVTPRSIETGFSAGTPTIVTPTIVTPTTPPAFGMPVPGDASWQNDFRAAITGLLGETSNQPRVIRRPESFGSRIEPRHMPEDEFEKKLLEKYRKSPNLPPQNEGGAVIRPEDIEKWAAEGYIDQVPLPISPGTRQPPPGTRAGTTPLEMESEIGDEIDEAKNAHPPFEYRTDAEGYYYYYEPRWAEAGACLDCHRGDAPDLEPGDLIGIVKVTIIDPPSEVVATEYWVRLLVSSILTATLAMLAFYIIIRWVIIKPLRHLRKISDAISHGDITQRAELHTGDEYETLALAFNRMIRHILNTQEKLRGINVELDQRVDQLARLNMQLYESNRVKSDFMATMSHELRTPLNSIIGFSEVLGSIDSLDEKQKRYVENISKSGKTLLSMINDILDMAKIEAGRIVVQPSTFSINSIVGAQCDMAKPLGDRKNIDIECDMPDHLPPIQQDASRLQQILNNLLSNAIKFTPGGGRIKVQVRRIMPKANGNDGMPIEPETPVPRSKTGRHKVPETAPAAEQTAPGQPQPIREPLLELKVVDTGVGISEEDQQIIFEKFRQGKNSMTEGDAMKREYAGSGLGLSIVKELCRLLDGSVTVESQLGLGSTFTVLLPWLLEPKTRIESEMMADLQEFAKSKPRTKGHKI